MANIKRLIFLAAALLALPAAAQDFLPMVRSYLSGDYGAGRQNWSACSGPDGVMYFGNDDGLLDFDGEEWRLNRLPSGKTVRSILCEDDRIYVGSYEEFGYFSPAGNGELQYSSLSDLLADYDMSNDEIWRILPLGKRIVFQAFRSFFVYDGESVGARDLEEFCLFFNEFEGRIITSAEKSGTSLIDPGTGEITPMDAPFSSQLVGIIPDGAAKGVSATVSDGLFFFVGNAFLPFRTDADGLLEKAQVNCISSNGKGELFVGTRHEGVLVFSRNGRLISRLDGYNALPGNSVQGLSTDRENNLWVALDGGLAMVSADSGTRFIASMTPSVGEIFTAAYVPPLLYLGTNQGLFTGNLSENTWRLSGVKKLDSVKEYVLNLSVQGDQLMCGTNAGTYEIDGRSANEVCPVTGGAWFERGTVNGKEILVEGTYTLLCIYLRRNNRWTFSHTVDGFMEPVNKLYIAPDGTIYARHIYGTVYRMRLSEDLRTAVDVETVTEEEIPQPLRESTAAFRSLPDGYREAFRFADSLKLCVSNNSLALVRDRNEGPEHESPGLGIKKIRFSDIYSGRDSLMALNAANPGLSHRMRNAEFRLLWPEYSNRTLFRTMLEGLDKVWQPPSPSRTWTYRYLSPGHYVFRARAESALDGSELASLEYPFTIRQPWYLSLAAKLALLTLMLAAVFWLVRRFRRKEILKRETLEKAFSAEKAALENKVHTQQRELQAVTDEMMKGEWCRRLKNRYPALTPNDLRFCTYLRMNLSSRDIADLQNITLKGVEAARARVRKKIGLPSKESLTSFLIKFN